MNSRLPSFTLVLAGLLCGCAHEHAVPRVPPVPAPDITSPLPQGLDLQYTLELVRDPFVILKVTLALNGSAAGQTFLKMSKEWGGVENAENEIHKLEVRDRQGNPLRVQLVEPRRWAVWHKPGETLTATYFVVSTVANTPHSSSSSEVYYRPIVNESLVHVLGTTGFLYPDVDGAVERRIGLSWRGFAQAGWKVVSSFSVDQSGFVQKTSLDDLRHAAYVAAPDLRIVTRTVRDHPVHFAVVGSDWRFDVNAFADLGARIFAVEREFFADFSYPYYLVTLIPVGTATRDTSTGGTGLHNTFALFMTRNIEMKGYTGMRVKHLLAHELFHNWNGRVIGREEPQAAVYWFSEGFTEFYTGRLLFRAGLISLEEYRDLLNEELREYFLSPVRNAPNERIAAGFWKDPGSQRMPYRRGEFTAWLLDAEIRRASNNVRSLDDFMRELVVAAREHGDRLSTEKLLDRIARWTSKEFAGRIRGIVVGGATAELDRSTTGRCFDLGAREEAQFDIGFNFQEAKSTHLVTGVRKGSRAYAAGLRDNLRLRTWSVQGRDASKPVTLTVEDGTGERAISYMPEGATITVPVLVIRKSGSCAGGL